MRASLLATAIVAMLTLSGSGEPAQPSFQSEVLAQAAKKQEPKKAKPKAKNITKREATPPEALYTLPGFQVELLHTADPTTEGSWICMCKDHKGRLIISGQDNQPILLVTLKDGKVASLEPLPLPIKISGAMGLLYAHNSLYINGNGPNGYGLYRFRDTKNADKYDDVQFLKRFEGAGEHGPHGIALGPDNKLYIMNGNHTRVPEGLSPQSPHRNYREDLLLPRQWDGNGHAAGILAPGGYVVRTDADGKHWELLLAGFRNAYDHAFNADGELFTFDSDMEWDWGMPWYRPVRVNHCTSAAEFGWRSGTGKWPEYYVDSLGAVVNIGIGSPTGVCNGIGAKFPAKYQKAIYILDWTYGRILAVHLTPKGSTYTGTFENFVAPAGLVGKGPTRPLNVTDAVIGDDGAMYFTIGGRNTQAALYRVSYVGSESTAPAELRNKEGEKERALRRSLEAFHGKENPAALEAAWPHLNSDDRALRYAARIAIESQPVSSWQAKALAETQPTAAITALVALARNADAKVQPELLQALLRLDFNKLTLTQQLDWLRCLHLSFIRQGRPSVSFAQKILAVLEPRFPDSNELLNREVVQTLIYLHSPVVVTRALKQMATAKTQADQFHYLFHLRTMPIGFWTMEQRKEYLSYWTAARKKLPASEETEQWFKLAGRGYGDGASFNNFLKNFLREAVDNLSDAERKELAGLLASIDKNITPTYDVKPRKFVKEWKMDELMPLLDQVSKGRNYERGREAYLAAQCIKCHRMGNEGGAVGPDLTAIASRFSRRDMLESILEPSKVLSDQYQNTVVTTTRGKQIVGRIVDDSAERLVIQPDPLSPQRIEIKKAEIESREPSSVSPMPANLVDVLSAEEILDLIAYMEAAGRRNHPNFRKK